MYPNKTNGCLLAGSLLQPAGMKLALPIVSTLQSTIVGLAHPAKEHVLVPFHACWDCHSAAKPKTLCVLRTLSLAFAHFLAATCTLDSKLL